MAEGRTYPFPEDQTLGEARPWWMEQAPAHLWRSLGFEVIGTVPEAFDHPDDGLFGLHVMYQRPK
ncbi:hypothetical protein [Microtetraspora malaysiensis]|uniref:hypothetical protein n=1 Tax=Microtetraspora malaysiensis TaxID=161358 RepID=UPI001C3F2378|nr:hypothetical protein [Microtetraspora malaysiensis]